MRPARRRREGVRVRHAARVPLRPPRLGAAHRSRGRLAGPRAAAALPWRAQPAAQRRVLAHAGPPLLSLGGALRHGREGRRLPRCRPGIRPLLRLPQLQPPHQARAAGEGRQGQGPAGGAREVPRGAAGVEEVRWRRPRHRPAVPHHPNSLLHARAALSSAVFVLSDFGRYHPRVASLEKDVIAPYKHMAKTFLNDSAGFDDRPTLLYFRGAIYRKEVTMLANLAPTLQIYVLL
jgi:hypothetical protein